MKKWVYISDIADHVGEEITLKGWLAGRRGSGKIHFLQFRDGTGFIQGVLARVTHRTKCSNWPVP